jgi:hypothetical protein
LNRLISTTVAAISEAVIGPIPGIVARRRAIASLRACARIATSKAWMPLASSPKRSCSAAIA